MSKYIINALCNSLQVWEAVIHFPHLMQSLVCPSKPLSIITVVIISMVIVAIIWVVFVFVFFSVIATRSRRKCIYWVEKQQFGLSRPSVQPVFNVLTHRNTSPCKFMAVRYLEWNWSNLLARPSHLLSGNLSNCSPAGGVIETTSEESTPDIAWKLCRYLILCTNGKHYCVP